VEKINPAVPKAIKIKDADLDNFGLLSIFCSPISNELKIKIEKLKLGCLQKLLCKFDHI